MQNPCLMHKDGQIFCSGTRNGFSNGINLCQSPPIAAMRLNARKTNGFGNPLVFYVSC